MNFTNEQIKKNREYVAKVMDEVIDKARRAELWGAIVFHWCFIGECLEYRVAFFEDADERRMWKEEAEEIYKTNNIPYISYNFV